jgi:pimeloyl-ACP methyl ester carboxylesterase
MRRALTRFWRQPGSLVAFKAGGRMLDGFWSHDLKPRPVLLVLAHGMGGDFYHSALKKELMAKGPAAGCDVLSFNNRGSGDGVRSERFLGCLADLDAALAFGRREGYRRFILAGHSTGCQKIAFYQSRRQDPAVEALVHLAPGDDYAIVLRDMGARALARLAGWARDRIAAGRGEDPLPTGRGAPEMCAGFTARRFLSISEPRQTEAGLFQYDGPMRVFSRLTLPMLVLFGDREEFACLPPAVMGDRLREKTASRLFLFSIIPGADHGFHGKERETAAAVTAFIRSLPGKGRPSC